MSKHKTVYLVWLVALISVVIMTFHYQARSARFFGIAETQEQAVSFPHPVALRKIHVLSGQQIEKGSLIVEAIRPDLVAQIAIIDHRIEELAAEKSLLRAQTTTELQSLRAEKDSKMVEFDYQIQELENLYRLNQRLAAKEVETQPSFAPSPIRTKMEGLRKKKQHIEKSLQARIDNLQDQLVWPDSPLEAKTEMLRTERNALTQKQEELKYYASADGMIGSVFFGVGEEVPPFEPVLTIHPKTPSYVKGYIHEDVSNDIQVNQRVQIHPLSSKSADVMLNGTVKSIGARIVEYPERLKRQHGIPVWGREVLISLQQDNALLLGEKVSIVGAETESHTTMTSAVDGFVHRIIALWRTPPGQG